MKHRLILPCLLLAVALATAGLSGCGAASRTPAPEFSSGADAAPSPDVAETASPAPVTGEAAWPVPETGIDFAPIQDFAPAGVVRAISDSQPGAGSDTGYYAIDRLQDGSARITFVDYATKQQIVLCSQPNCTHTSDACPAWYSYDNALRVYPLGDQLVVLHGRQLSAPGLAGGPGRAPGGHPERRRQRPPYGLSLPVRLLGQHHAPLPHGPG